MITVLIFGALGGVARGLVGFSKYYLSYKNVEFKWQYIGLTVGLSAIVGLGAVWAIKGSGITFAEGIEINKAVAMIIGYAGGDAIENIYKLIAKKPISGPLGDIIG